MKVDKAINLEDLRRMAKRRLPRLCFDFIEGGLEDERGLARNERTFDTPPDRCRAISSTSRNATSAPASSAAGLRPAFRHRAHRGLPASSAAAVT